MGTQLDVELDNQDGIFYPGSVLTGRVIINMNGTLNGVKIIFKGQSHVKFITKERRRVDKRSDERGGDRSSNGSNGIEGDRSSNGSVGREGDSDRRQNIHRSRHELEDEYEVVDVTHVGGEEYFCVKQFIFGDGSETFYLNPGVHRMPFQFTLPTKIPTSYEGEFGNIRYTIRAVISRPWRFDHEKVRIFTVNNPLDLNTKNYTKYLNPVGTKDHKSLCCLCCKSGPNSVTMILTRSGSVPGEKLIINAEIDNKSNKTMDGSQIL